MEGADDTAPNIDVKKLSGRSRYDEDHYSHRHQISDDHRHLSRRDPVNTRFGDPVNFERERHSTEDTDSGHGRHHHSYHRSHRHHRQPDDNRSIQHSETIDDSRRQRARENHKHQRNDYLSWRGHPSDVRGSRSTSHHSGNRDSESTCNSERREEYVGSSEKKDDPKPSDRHERHRSHSHQTSQWRVSESHSTSHYEKDNELQAPRSRSYERVYDDSRRRDEYARRSHAPSEHRGRGRSLSRNSLSSSDSSSESDGDSNGHHSSSRHRSRHSHTHSRHHTRSRSRRSRSRSRSRSKEMRNKDASDQHGKKRKRHHHSESRDKKQKRKERERDKGRDKSRKRDHERRERKEEERRSVLTGKKIKLKIKQDKDDIEREKNRMDLLMFLNSAL